MQKKQKLLTNILIKVSDEKRREGKQRKWHAIWYKWKGMSVWMEWKRIWGGFDQHWNKCIGGVYLVMEAGEG